MTRIHSASNKMLLALCGSAAVTIILQVWHHLLNVVNCTRETLPPAHPHSKDSESKHISSQYSGFSFVITLGFVNSPGHKHLGLFVSVPPLNLFGGIKVSLPASYLYLIELPSLGTVTGPQRANTHLMILYDSL